MKERGMYLSDRVHVLALDFFHRRRWVSRKRRRMVVHDLPDAVELTPHVREARLHRLAVVLGTSHEGVHSGVKVRIVAVILNVISRDGALGQLLKEIDEVFLRRFAVANEFRRDSREER